jgi:hypothetical protein
MIEMKDMRLQIVRSLDKVAEDSAILGNFVSNAEGIIQA